MSRPGTFDPQRGPAPYGSRNKPSGGAELYAWIFMRLSGLALLFLAVGHLLIMHVFNSIHSIDYDFVAARYERMFWRGYDLTMLWLALIHGLNGLRTILDDILKGFVRDVAVRVLYVLGVCFLAIGTYAVVAFHPVVAR